MTVSPRGVGNKVTISDGAGLNVTPDSYPKNYNCSESYTLTSVPGEGYEFITWIVNDGQADRYFVSDPTSVSVADGPITVTAEFRSTDDDYTGDDDTSSGGDGGGCFVNSIVP